jgi:hypothetical membrane protein
MRAIATLIPIVWFGLIFAAGLARPGYDHFRQYVTELGVGPNAWIIQLDSVIVGGLLLAFAAMLRRAGVPAVAAMLVGVKAAATVGAGLITGDADVTARTTQGLVHNGFVVVGNAAMVAACVIVGVQWRQRRTLSLGTAAVIAISTILLAVATPQGTGSLNAPLAAWAGLIQRISMAANYLWPAGLIFMPREGPPRERAAPSRT